MTKRDRLNDSSMLQRRISAKTMKIDVNQGSARRGLPLSLLESTNRIKRCLERFGMSGWMVQTELR